MIPTKANQYLWGFIIILAVIDLIIRRQNLVFWSLMEWGFYLLSILFAGCCALVMRTALLKWCGNRKKLLIGALLVLNGIIAFVDLGSYQFYDMFKNFPNITSIRFVLEETGEFLTYIEPNFLLLVIFPLTTLALTVIWLGLIRACPTSEQPVRFSKISLGVLLILTPVFHNNVRLSQGNFLPGANFWFSLTMSLNNMFSNQGNIRVLQVRLIPKLPQIPETPKFNVVFLFHESLRAQSCSLYGYPRKTTPNQDKFLLEKYPENSFVFERAYSNSTNTHLSYPSTLSGVHPGQSHQKLHGVPLFFEYAKMFPDLKNFLIASHSYDYGNFKLFVQSPQLDKLWFRELGKKPAFNNLGADDQFIHDEFVDFLDQTDLKANHILGVLHFNGTHYPFTVRKESEVWDPLQFNGRERTMTEYDNAIHYVDHVVGQVLDQLEKRGMLQNTIIISSADHGEAMAEHWGEYGHLKRFYDESVRIPFWIYIPDALLAQYQSILSVNRNIPVNNIDIIPSLQDLLKIKDRPEIKALTPDLQGFSLFSPLPEDRYIVLQNSNAYYTHQFSSLGIVHGDHKFLFYISGEHASLEYYNLRLDPLEQKNLWDQAPPEEVRKLKAFIKQDRYLEKWVSHSFFPDL
ncbi:MAG: sulfatase-like hydrolase/transferase [SAR324 cluster bacterium]|nr:sulfatase-like hydrolase/transferase [SAR324 cluster bacterium]